MHKINQYVRPAPRYSRLLYTACILLAACAMGLLALAHRDYQRVQGLRKQSELLRPATRAGVARKPTRLEMDLEKRWQALAAERGFMWAPVLNALERASSEDVELLLFQPDKHGRWLLLRGEGRDRLAVIEFMDRLSRQAVFKDVHLTQQKTNSRDALNTMLFEIKATIRP